MHKDQLFAQPRKELSNFIFDQAVVDVFPDMIRRSVPGYEQIITMLGVFSRYYAQEHSTIYDLGCSLGAATLSAYQQQPFNSLHYVAVDNSLAMLKQCKTNLNKHIPNIDISYCHENIQDTPISNASLIFLNFTLQFIPITERKSLIQRLYNGLNSGGALILSEKIQLTNKAQDDLLTNLHHEFKRANCYSNIEISQKRTALEKVLIPDTIEQHIQRLEKSGFKAQLWFQNLNFVSFLAVKE